jgi:MerR family copper efflux transcriptional regulator
MNIGEVSKLSGVSQKLIRHYEEIGLIKKAARTTNGYRVYREQDIHILRFIARSRNLGFNLSEIKKLIDLWSNKKRKSQEVKKLATDHLSKLKIKILELQSIVETLEHLTHCCHGDNRPDCPIIIELENN